jgi:Tyrosine phosphatase family
MASLRLYDKTWNLPTPPFINVANIPNFRDLGGYAISQLPKHSIRRNFIYRCAEPSRITSEGVSTLRSLGITHAYDLRSPKELERRNSTGLGGITEWDGCERVFVPVFSAQNSSPEDLALRYKDYGSDGTEVGRPLFQSNRDKC